MLSLLLLLGSIMTPVLGLSCIDRYGTGLNVGDCKTHESYNPDDYCYAKPWYYFGGCKYLKCNYPSMWQCSTCDDGYRIIGNSRGWNDLAGYTTVDNVKYKFYHCKFFRFFEKMNRFFLFFN